MKQTNLIKNLLDEHYQKIKNEYELEINSKIPGVFLLGFLSGIIVNYSNILGLLTGAFIGFSLTKYYSKITDSLTLKFSELINLPIKLFREKSEF